MANISKNTRGIVLPDCVRLLFLKSFITNKLAGLLAALTLFRRPCRFRSAFVLSGLSPLMCLFQQREHAR